jgi:two-component system sensor histidine kinase KdpD
MFYTKTATKQYFTAAIWVCAVAALSYPFTEIIGYRSVALLLLLTVSVLAMRLSLYPVLLAAFLSALIWDFFFIPPKFTFIVSKTEDVLMLAMYFIVALLNGVLTSRIRFFEQLARRKEARAATLKLYDTLFNSLSHELRTPIATILGASDNLLTTNANLTENDKTKLYEQINFASERLQRLTENLLNLSRLESGFLQPKLDWCDVSELIYTAVNSLEQELKNHKVKVEIPDNMPLVKLDFGLMEQAIYNILYNASIYTPAGSAISISAEYLDLQCVITIADNGPGFPKEDLDSVFEKFYRSENAKPGGLGLGLSITKGFVDAHNGNIKVENQWGGGAKFTIQIPAEANYMNLVNDEQPDNFGH